MILITGAGGKTSKALVKALSSGETIRALVHRQEQISGLKTLGADQIVVGDLHDEAVILAAMEGARAVYHICPNMNPEEVEIGQSVIDAARKSKVDRFVYHSVLHPQTEKMNHHWQKMRVEEMILESGLPFTILQPAPYMQNLLAGWKSILEEGVLRVPYSVYSKFSFVDLEDVAEAAKTILTQSGHVNAIYELASTMPISHLEVAAIFEHALKREVQAMKQDVGDWRLRAKGMSEYAIENLVTMFEYYDQWGLAGNPNVLKWILNREPTSLESFVHRILSQNDTTD